MITISITALTSVPGHFSAAHDGTTIVPKSRQPMLDASRALLTTENSTWPLAMVHSGSTIVALTGIIGKLATLETNETPWGPVFRPHRPRQGDPGCILPSTS